MNIISEILFLCQQNNLSQEEKEQLNYIFSNKIIDVNYDDYSFILISSFYGNSDMINILKNNNADIIFPDPSADASCGGTGNFRQL